LFINVNVSSPVLDSVEVVSFNLQVVEFQVFISHPF
jgi:hypothetical protein